MNIHEFATSARLSSLKSIGVSLHMLNSLLDSGVNSFMTGALLFTLLYLTWQRFKCRVPIEKQNDYKNPALIVLSIALGYLLLCGAASLFGSVLNPYIDATTTALFFPSIILTILVNLAPFGPIRPTEPKGQTCLAISPARYAKFVLYLIPVLILSTGAVTILSALISPRIPWRQWASFAQSYPVPIELIIESMRLTVCTLAGPLLLFPIVYILSTWLIVRCDLNRDNFGLKPAPYAIFLVAGQIWILPFILAQLPGPVQYCDEAIRTLAQRDCIRICGCLVEIPLALGSAVMAIQLTKVRTAIRNLNSLPAPASAKSTFDSSQPS